MSSELLIKVSIADDHKIFRKGVILSLRPYTNIKFVLEAENGQEGLTPAADSRVPPIHGILLDVHKPVPDGLAPLHALRRLYPGIPVVVMSDASHIQTAREAVNQGAKEYVLKPFDSELLKTKCLRVF